MYDDINCPYCGAGQEINHDDGFGYEENVKHQMHCGECDKNFVFTTSISYNYEPEKADCLNSTDHKFNLTHTAPREFSKMACDYCAIERELTDQERDSFQIGTRESYIESLNPKIK